MNFKRLPDGWISDPIDQIRQLIALLGAKCGQVVVRYCQESKMFSTYACDRNKKNRVSSFCKATSALIAYSIKSEPEGA